MRNKIAEEATGIKQNGKLGNFYDRRGIKMPIEEARAVLDMGETIEVPNAGAGSYRDVFMRLGFKDVQVIDWTASAGDWCFGVLDTDGWRFAGQENRWPRYGFLYSVDKYLRGYKTFNDLVDVAMDYQGK